MKLLFITASGFDSFGGSNHLNIALIEDLLKKNHEVLLIQSQITNDSNIPKVLLDYSNFSFYSIQKRSTNKRKMFRRGFAEIKYYKSIIKYLNSNMGFELAYVQSSGMVSYFIPKLKKKLNIPIIFNIQDLFPDSLNILRKKYLLPIMWFFRLTQKRVYNIVDNIIVISDDIKNQLIKRKVDGRKITIAYNWYNDEEIYPVNINENKFCTKFNLEKNKFIVQYAGNLGYVLDYDFIIKVASILKDQKNIVFQIIGEGSNKSYLVDLCEKHQLSNVEFFPIQPLNIVRDVYSFADLCFIPLKKGVIYHSVPSKASLCLACSTPVLLICDKESIYSNIIKDKKVGEVFSNEEYQNAANFILNLANKNVDINYYKNNTTIVAKNNFSRYINTAIIVDVLEKSTFS